MTVIYWGPPGTEPPTGDDGAGRPITITPTGVTRWEPLGTTTNDPQEKP